MRVIIALLLSILAVVVYGSATDYLACDADPTIPATKLCWDASLNAVRPNVSLVMLSNMACCPSNVTTSLVIPSNYSVYMGVPMGGANESRVQGSLRIERGALLSVTATNLTVDGDFILASGARLRVSQSNATRTHISVGGCLIFEAPFNITNLTIELDVVDGNHSRSYVIFSVPSGCVNGSFGNVNTSYTLTAGQNDVIPPGASQCIQPAGLAVLVDMVCSVDAPSNITGDKEINGNGLAVSGTVLWTIVGVVVGGVALAVVMTIVLVKVQKTRSSLFPYRDRVHFQPHTSNTASHGNVPPTDAQRRANTL